MRLSICAFTPSSRGQASQQTRPESMAQTRLESMAQYTARKYPRPAILQLNTVGGALTEPFKMVLRVLELFI